MNTNLLSLQNHKTVFQKIFFCCFLFFGVVTVGFSQTDPPIVQDVTYCLYDVASPLTAVGEQLL